MNAIRERGGLGVLLLCVWLILSGILALFHLQFSGEDTILGLLMVGAGVLILVGR